VSTNNPRTLRETLDPMDSVAVLYGEGKGETAQAICASLNRRIFEGKAPAPSDMVRRGIARLVLRLLRSTTQPLARTGPDGNPMVYYRNPILEKCGHPYAATLLEPSRADTSSFVEGGDPMNAIYMMLAPEIARNATLWDKFLLDSVQSRDVQWRFVHETLMTHELAAARLKRGQSVRMKAVAGGTGLSMILVLEQLLREGYDPSLISATITDREESNIRKAQRLLEKLAGTRLHLNSDPGAPGISVHTEDILDESAMDTKTGDYDIITLVGILEYFPGTTYITSEENLGEPAPEGPADATDLIRKIGRMAAASGHLITNTYRLGAAAQLLETFGKRFRYRGREEMCRLVAAGGFVPTGKFASANIFDVEVFEKRSG